MGLNTSIYGEVAQKNSLEQANDSASLEPKNLVDEAKHLQSLTLPFMLANILAFLPGVVALILVGHVNSPDVQLYIGAASLGDIYFNITGYSTGLGIASAMDTICSQAFGAGDIKRIGLVFQTGLLVLAGLFLPAIMLNIFAVDVLLFFHNPIEVSVLAAKYAQCLFIGLPFVYVYELLEKTLQAQNVAFPMIYCSVVCNIVNVTVGYSLIHYCNMGLLGAALGRTAGNIFLPLSLIPYYWKYGDARLMWPGFQPRAALNGVGEFLRIGVPGMLMTMFERCTFQCLVIFSGCLPNPVMSLCVNEITLSVHAFLDEIYICVAVAATVRVGNAIGAKDTIRTRMAVKAAAFATILVAVISITILLIAKNSYPYLFTNDTSIARTASGVATVVLLYQVPQAVNQTTQGILRGYGLQRVGASINFVAYILVGLPVGYALAFVWHWDVIGLWLGIAVASFVAAIMGIVIVSRSKLISEYSLVHSNALAMI